MVKFAVDLNRAESAWRQFHVLDMSNNEFILAAQEGALPVSS
jgi:hypothetical protein